MWDLFWYANALIECNKWANRPDINGYISVDIWTNLLCGKDLNRVQMFVYILYLIRKFTRKLNNKSNSTKWIESFVKPFAWVRRHKRNHRHDFTFFSLFVSLSLCLCLYLTVCFPGECAFSISPSWQSLTVMHIEFRVINMNVNLEIKIRQHWLLHETLETGYDHIGVCRFIVICVRCMLSMLSIHFGKYVCRTGTIGHESKNNNINNITSIASTFCVHILSLVQFV